MSVAFQDIVREALKILSPLKASASLRSFTQPTMRSALVEAIGAWRAEAILGPAPTTTIKIRKPPAYEQLSNDSSWMGM